MSTNYSLTDGLPKDSGAQKLLAWIDDGTSQLDFALPRGIGSESIGNTSKIVSAAQVGTHTIGSAVGHQVISVGGGIYSEAPSAIGTGNAQANRINAKGTQYVQQASTILSFDTTSAQVHILGSALLNFVRVNLSNVNSGDSVTIGDGTGTRLTFLATTNGSAQFDEKYPGLFFGTDIRHTRSVSPAAAATSVTIGFSRDS